MGESTSYSMMGSVLKQSQDREGVRIDAPHGWVINDVHHAWTKNETYHWETGNIFHMTSGQVYHASLNLAEVHTTTNALTMHVDMTPINFHMRPNPVGIDVHLDISPLRKHINLHCGHHHDIMRTFSHTAQELHLESERRPLPSWASLAAVGPPPAHPGTITLAADDEMLLKSYELIDLVALSWGESAPSAAVTINETGEAIFYAKKLLNLASNEETLVEGGGSQVALKDGEINIKAGKASVTLNDGKLTTTATGGTRIKGRVSLGEPAIVEPEIIEQVNAAEDAIAAAVPRLNTEIAKMLAKFQALQ